MSDRFKCQLLIFENYSKQSKYTYIYKWNKQLILPVSWLGVRCLYSTLNSDLHLSSVTKSLDLSPLSVLKVVTDASALCWPHGIDLTALHIHRLWAQTASTSVTFALRFTQDASGFSLVDCFQKKKKLPMGGVILSWRRQQEGVKKKTNKKSTSSLIAINTWTLTALINIH